MNSDNDREALYRRDILTSLQLALHAAETVACDIEHHRTRKPNSPHA